MDWLSVRFEEMLKLVPKVSFISISSDSSLCNRKPIERVMIQIQLRIHTENNELEIDKNT